MSVSLSRPRLPLIPLPYPLILLPSARLTFPIPNNQADALIRLFDSSIANPVLAAVPFVQNDGTTSLHDWGVTARIARFVRPRAHSDEPYLLTLTGITRIRLTCSTNKAAPSTSDASSHSLPHVTVIHPPPDAQSPPAPDVVQDFKAAAIRLLERFAHDASQSARKRESWARIVHVVDETELDKAAALADAIVSAVGAEHPDKLGECLSFLFHITSFKRIRMRAGGWVISASAAGEAATFLGYTGIPQSFPFFKKVSCAGFCYCAFSPRSSFVTLHTHTKMAR
jgi:ATP-dependent Lon protease